jgi:putative serine/threonine protein kinase
LKELQKLKIETLEFKGAKNLLNVPVLGKGCVGIVVIADRNREHVALKIRRVDADRSGMQREAKLLDKANSVSVGPKLLGVSRNFLLMQFVEGTPFPVWITKHRGKKRLERILREFLEQCWRLDEIGLDHGELSHAPKHLLVDAEDRCFIVDFETASVNRRPSNVTSVCQFLFIGSQIAKTVNMRLGTGDTRKGIEVLRQYKNDVSFENFIQVLKAFGLDYVG